MKQFALVFENLEYGSAIARVSAGEQSLTLYISYLSDGLGDLLRAVVALVNAPVGSETSCAWQDEPGEHRWLFRRIDDDTVHIKVVAFDRTFSQLADDKGLHVFQTSTSARRLATQVAGQFHQWMNEYGEDGYAARWRHSFPMAAYSQLETAIRLRSRQSARLQIP